MSAPKPTRFRITRTQTIEVEVTGASAMLARRSQARLIAESCFDIDDDDERSRRQDLPCDYSVGRAEGTVTSYSASLTIVRADAEPKADRPAGPVADVGEVQP